MRLHFVNVASVGKQVVEWYWARDSELYGDVQTLRSSRPDRQGEQTDPHAGTEERGQTPVKTSPGLRTYFPTQLSRSTASGVALRPESEEEPLSSFQLSSIPSPSQDVALHALLLNHAVGTVATEPHHPCRRRSHLCVLSARSYAVAPARDHLPKQLMKYPQQYGQQPQDSRPNGPATSGRKDTLKEQIHTYIHAYIHPGIRTYIHTYIQTDIMNWEQLQQPTPHSLHGLVFFSASVAYRPRMRGALHLMNGSRPMASPLMRESSYVSCVHRCSIS